MKVFLKRIGIALIRPYGISFLIFFLSEISLTVWLTSDTTPTRIELERTLSGLSMMMVYLLVAFNTVVFMRHITPILSPILQSLTTRAEVAKDEEEKKKAKKERATSSDCFTGVTITLLMGAFLCGGFSIIILCGWFGLFQADNLSITSGRPIDCWRLIIKVSEVGSMLVFGLFLMADFACLELCKLGLKTQCCSCANMEAIKREEKAIGKYIAAVDLPGFCGVCLICFISHSIYPNVLNAHTASLPYWQGFSAGAITLHIAFSQAALAFLPATEE